MACRCTTTELAVRSVRRAALLLVAATLLGALAPGAVRAHEPSRLSARELVRLAGWFGTPPDGVEVVREVAVSAQGRQRTLHATEWHVYAVVADQKDVIAPAPEQVVLQGSRAELAAVAGARPDQRVAILAERRPGVGELFLLAVDICPAK
jgi:hypothetical protein